MIAGSATSVHFGCCLTKLVQQATGSRGVVQVEGHAPSLGGEVGQVVAKELGGRLARGGNLLLHTTGVFLGIGRLFESCA